MSRESRAKFWHESVEMLRLELAQLGATHITLCTGHRKIELGDDGWPSDSLANAITNHPGVQLAFQCDYGWLHFLCDAFQQWEVNFRCIGETLQNLGGMNMLKMVGEGKVYTPFKVKNNPFPGARFEEEDVFDDEEWTNTTTAGTKNQRTGSSFDDEESIPSSVPDKVVIAGTWISARCSVKLGTLLKSEESLKRAYREIARKLHPDVETGDHESFVQLGQYVEVIEKYQRQRR